MRYTKCVISDALYQMHYTKCAILNALYQMHLLDAGSEL